MLVVVMVDVAVVVREDPSRLRLSCADSCLSCVNWKDLAVRLMDIYCVELLHHGTSQGPPITDCGQRRGEERRKATIFQILGGCLFKTCSQLEAN